MRELTWRASVSCPVSPYTVADLAGSTETSRLRATVMTLYATQAELEEARGLLAQLKVAQPDAPDQPSDQQLELDLRFD